MPTVIDLTERYPWHFDLGALRADLARLHGDTDWLGHYDPTMSRGWQAIPLVSLGGRMDTPEAQRPLPRERYAEYQPTPILARLPAFRALLDRFRCPKGRVRILKLLPGEGIGVHRDIRHEVASVAFGQVRLHLPIETNPQVTFVVGRKRLQMAEGRLYYVDFTKRHWVENRGLSDRIHLVLDLAVNGWLCQIFPLTSGWERFGHLVQRRTLPWVWEAQRRAHMATDAAYQAYRDSGLRTVVHRLRGA